MKKQIGLFPWQQIFTLLLTVLLFSCGNKEEVGSESLISGADNKVWKAAKETNAQGDKQKIGGAEARQNIQFYADGRFAMGGTNTLQTGTWAFDQAAKRLTLQFENEDMTENFEVLKLTDDEMRLRTPEGSEMKLEAE